jgi:hypothetical protein
MADLDATTLAQFDIRPGTPGVGIDGELGWVSRVVTDPDGGQPAGLILRQRFPLQREIALPITLVEHAAGDHVQMRLTIDELDEYREDDQITDAVLDVLWYRSEIPKDELRSLGVQTTDGIVELSGNSKTEQGRQAIVALARQVPGVLGVRDRIRSLEALAEAARPFEHVRTSSQHRVGSE